MGTRHLAPDYHAILGETEAPGFFCAGGFSEDGFMHAPATGITMSRLIAGLRPPIDIKKLSPGCFSNNAAPETIIF